MASSLIVIRLRRSSALLVALALAFAAVCAHAGRVLVAQPSGSIPMECLETGLALRSACKAELIKAERYFGVTVKEASRLPASNVTAYTADPTNAPSAKCCAAALAFNGNGCDCNPAVVNLAKSFLGGNLDVYNQAVRGFAVDCSFTPAC